MFNVKKAKGQTAINMAYQYQYLLFFVITEHYTSSAQPLQICLDQQYSDCF